MSKGGRDPGPKADDAAAFAEAVRGVRKLGGVHRVVLPADVPQRPAALAGGSIPRSVSPPPGSGLTVETAGESWIARADGVDRRILRKLRDGRIPVEAQVDLHGLTRVKAADALDRLLVAARAASRRCLLVIHGRGLHSGADGPTLRDMVRDQVTTGRHAGAVLACATAPVALGGAGATVVYLRR